MTAAKFPILVKRGSVVVKIYRTPTRGCESFTISYYEDGLRKRRTAASLAEAKQEAEGVAGRIASGDAGLVRLTMADSASYLRAKELLDPFGIALETAAAEVANTRKRLGDVPLTRVLDDYLKRHPAEISAPEHRRGCGGNVGSETGGRLE